MGPSITGPILHGPTTQQSYTGHLQLAQQLTGVMGHSSSGLTLFGSFALHFYQGPSSAGQSCVPPNPSIPPSSHISRSFHVSPNFPSSSPLSHMSAGSLDSTIYASKPVSHPTPLHNPPQIYTNLIISLPSSPAPSHTTFPPIQSTPLNPYHTNSHLTPLDQSLVITHIKRKDMQQSLKENRNLRILTHLHSLS